MRQASLKIRVYASNINIIDNGNLHKKMLHIMLFMIAMLAFFYVLFLGNMVWNIVERKSLERYALVLSNDVRDLEQRYFSLSQDVSISLAHSLGFRETKEIYVKKQNIGSFSGITASSDEI